MKFIGIDLGTTLTEVGYYDDIKGNFGTLPVLQKKNYQAYVEDMTSICSVIYFRDDKEYYVGEFAKSMFSVEPDKVICNSKLHIGTPDILNCEKKAVECAKLILTECKRAITRALGPYEYEGLRQIIVTVPASFDTFKSQETLSAAKSVFADKKVKILDEPTAALIYHTFQQNKTNNQEFMDNDTTAKRILIYDIGGGTCDTCIMDVGIDISHDVNFLVTGRFSEFGGNDFDDKIAQMILSNFLEENKIEVKSLEENKLRKLLLTILPYASSLKIKYSLSEDLFERMSEDLKIHYFFKINDNDNDDDKNFIPLNMTINSDMISKAIDPLVNKAHRASRKNIFNDMDYALGELTRTTDSNKIDMILLTGGASMLPIIRKAFKLEYHEPVILINRPQDAVAIGAAIFSYLDSSSDDTAHLLTNYETDTTKFRPGFGSQYLLDVDGMILDVVIDSQVQLPFETTIEYKTTATNALIINVLFGSSRYDCKLKYISSHSINFNQIYDSVIQKGTPVSLTFKLDSDRTLKIYVQPYGRAIVPLEVDYYYGGNEYETI